MTAAAGRAFDISASRGGNARRDPTFGGGQENIRPVDIPASLQLLVGRDVEISPNALGSGGFCHVHSAFLKNRADEEVAVKMVNSEHNNAKTDLAMKNEALNMRHLRHKHIVHIEGILFDPRKPDACASIVMQKMDGNLLKFPHLPSMAWKEKNKLCLQIAEGLRFMHSQNFCHLDLKPENVLWKRNPDGSFLLVISDFGMSNVKIATDADAPSLHQDSTSLSNVLSRDRQDGTPRYMAPELLTREMGAAGSHSDVYAFAMVRFLRALL
jgi:serine/threonine protein kinase